MRKLVAPLAAIVVGALVAGAGTAGVAEDARINPGKGIGKVQLGMTLAQVKRALGGSPFGVVRRTNHGARGRYVEYTWEVGNLIVRTSGPSGSEARGGTARFASSALPRACPDTELPKGWESAHARATYFAPFPTPSVRSATTLERAGTAIGSSSSTRVEA